MIRSSEWRDSTGRPNSVRILFDDSAMLVHIEMEAKYNGVHHVFTVTIPRSDFAVYLRLLGALS